MQIAEQHDLLLHQMDVKTTYLNATIDCEIYIEQPQGFRNGENRVGYLNKSFYGLKESGRMWNNVLNEFLKTIFFVDNCLCLYTQKSKDSIIYTLIWVDDLIIAASNENLMNETKSLLKVRLKMTDLARLQTTQPTTVELSQWTQAAVQIVSNLPAPSNGGPIYRFWGMPAMRTRWMAGAATKAGDVETNPGPTTLNNKFWICDICHKEIHVRKQISIRCNRIEHWVHLRCAGIRQAQYTDTWTCHLHRES